MEFDCQVLIGVYPMVPVREPLENGHLNGSQQNGHDSNGHQTSRRPKIVKIVEEVLRIWVRRRLWQGNRYQF